MKVNLFLKSLWSLVLANEDFLLAGIRQFSIQKTSANEDISFDQAKFTHSSFVLAWHGFCACPHCYNILWNFQWTLDGVCIHRTLIVVYICKNLSKKMGFSRSRMFCYFNTMKNKNKNLPLFRIQFALEYESILFVHQSHCFLFLTDRMWNIPGLPLYHGRSSQSKEINLYRGLITWGI